MQGDSGVCPGAHDRQVSCVSGNIKHNSQCPYDLVGRLRLELSGGGTNWHSELRLLGSKVTSNAESAQHDLVSFGVLSDC